MTNLLQGIWRGAVSAALALAVVGGAVVPLEAQYFGRNKVQYRTFDFQVLQTEHFDIYYYPEMEVAARDAARMAERWYERLSRILNHEFELRQPIILYASHAHFQQTTAIQGFIGEGTGGVAEAFKQRVIMPVTGSYQETDHILGHEIVHAFQYDISGLGRAGGGLAQAAQRFNVPLWFVEGMAEYLAVGPIDSHTAMWLRDAALTGELPTIRQLSTDPRIFPYRYGHALWAYIGGRWGDATIGQILKLVGQGVPYPLAFERILNTTLDDVSDDWLAAIRRTYLPLLAERAEAREVARPLVTRRGTGGRMNLAPAVSPDGQWLAFLSELSLFDIELWLANAETGEVVRRLVRGTTFDPHYGSLRFISSSGTFSPDGSQFAFSALRQGRDVLVILDVANARVLREIEIPGVPDITNPSWSPDGASIAFSGMSGGLSNLYILELETGATRQLTDDRYAALMPAYSPDGRTIAFVTDQGPGTDFDLLRYGGYNIALLDVETGALRMAPAMDVETSAIATETGFHPINYNPQWTRDGRGLYFVSNRTGIPNVYRLDLEAGELFKVTEIFGGVAGITDLSPTLAVAKNADRLVFSAFERNGYNLYSISEAAALVGTAVPTTTLVATTPVPPEGTEADARTVPLPALLPPAPRPAEVPFNRVLTYLRDASTGLPSTEEAVAFPIVEYQPRLGLDYLGQPQVGVSTGGAFGRGGLYGGVAGIWSDMLGRHNLFGAVQAQGRLDEIGFSAAYFYQPQRWNYGVAAQRIPYVLGARRAIGQDPSTGLGIDQLQLYRAFDWTLQGMAQYPFSMVQRAEFTSGLRRIAQDVILQEVLFDPVTGRPVDYRERREDIQALNLFETSAALVYDAALLGFTSPFAGRRYRFQVSPTFGTIQFVQGLADYRHYLWANPFTLALRGVHFGRYGPDSEDPRVGDIFLGYPSLIRGYDYNRVSADCRDERRNTGQTTGTECETLQQLFGSRIGLVNAELRFPLVRALVIGTGIGFPPIEGIAFFDAGVAWTGAESLVFRRGIQEDPTERGLLTSVGVGGRINLLGFLILEIDYVNPLASTRGWHWQVAVQPGF
jgi:hypothetical protein